MGEEHAPWAHADRGRNGQLDAQDWPDLALTDDGLEPFDEGAWLTVAPGVQLRSGAAGPPTGATGRGTQLGSVRRASGDAAGASQSQSSSAEAGGGAQEVAALRSRAPRRARAVSAWGRVLRVAAAGAAVLVAIVVMLAVKSVGQSAPTAPTLSGSTGVAATSASGAAALTATPTAQPKAGAEADEGAAPTPASGGPAAQIDWWSVLAELDRRRAAALAAADVEAVSGYAAAESAYRDGEIRLVERLSAHSLSPRGWTTILVAVESARELSDSGDAEASSVTPPGASTVRLTVVDRRSRYDLVNPSGEVVRTVAAAGKRRWQLTLVRSEGASPSAGARGSEAEADARSAVADDAAVASPPAGGAASTTSDPGGTGEDTGGADESGGWRIAAVEAVQGDERPDR